MDLIIIEDYVEKVYGFAINHTYSYEEADELSQEILFTAVKELPKLRNENKFEPWLWGIANNVLKVFRRNMGIQSSRNLESRGTFSHYTYKFADFIFRKMMPDDYINVCEDILLKKKTDDEYSAAKAICEGYIIRNENDELLLTIPAFTKDQKNQLDSLVIKYMSELMPEYSEIVNNFADKYKKLFPKHLSEDADRMIQGLFFGFYEYIVLYGQKKGLIESPAPGSICDVLIQHK